MKKLLLGTAMSLVMFASASAADMYVKAPPAWGWTGFYVGVNAGYIDPSGDLVDTTATITSTSTFPANATAQAAGATAGIGKGSGNFLGGAQAGFNYSLSPTLLAGIEADIQGSALRENGSVTTLSPVAGAGGGATWQTQITASRSLDYLGTLRGRAGFTSGGWLLYATGGLAYGGVGSNTSIAQSGFFTACPGCVVPTPASSSGSFSGTLVGYAVGGGAEWRLASNWSAKAEYLYYDLGSVSYSNGSLAFNVSPTNFPGFGISSIASASSTHFNGQIVRLGLNYKLP